MSRKTKESAVRCSFCHKSQDVVGKLISSPSEPQAYICNECIEVCDAILADDRETGQTTTVGYDELVKYVGTHVIGQDSAIKRLAMLFHAHTRKTAKSGLFGSNIVLAGPAGCGKSYAVQRLSEALNLPCAAVDATKILISTYLGNQDPIAKLYSAAEGQGDRASRGVLCIENLERIGDASVKNEEGSQIQQALLTILYGTLAKVSDNSNRREAVFLDTARVLVVGCFTLAKTQASENVQVTDSRDLIRLGFLPEFAAQFAHCVCFEELTEADLINILKLNGSALVRQYEKLFEHDRIKLTFSDEALEGIARECTRRSGSARSLSPILEVVALCAAMECADLSHPGTFVIDRRFVERSLRNDDQNTQGKTRRSR